jgi:hypothetical protein
MRRVPLLRHMHLRLFAHFDWPPLRRMNGGSSNPLLR